MSTSDSQVNSLALCPFCGGEAEILTAESMNGGYLFGIMCNDCRSRGDVYDTEAEAVAAWNTRAERTCRNASYRVDESRFHCSECEFGCWVKDVADGRDKLPRYCPNCGAKVVGE